MKKLFVIVFILAFAFISKADIKKIEIGIDEQLGKSIPLEAQFLDENGNKVLLRDLFTKPTVLSFVYYNCPGICSPLLMELSDIITKTDLVLGVDFNIVLLGIVSFLTDISSELIFSVFSVLEF